VIDVEAISNSDCEILSEKIKNEIFKPANIFKTTIFLCGADLSQKDKMRYKIAEALKGWIYSIYFDIIYPEDIFDELLYGSNRSDLLFLEGLLAESVDAIIVIPESPGSFAELGAFANNNLLREKLICVVDLQYKKDKSFINQGPLRLVKKSGKGHVLFVDPTNVEKDIVSLATSLRRMKKKSRKLTDKISLLQLDNFLLPAIYLLEPVSKDILQKMVSYVTGSQDSSFQTTTTALTILMKKRQIELISSSYRLTQLGLDSFFSLRKTSSRTKTQRETIAFDNLRLEILNLKLRNKPMRV